MTDLKSTISVTNATVEKMSRHDMLEWVNSTVHGQYKKIEELCSGVAYCQMMELLFPNTIGLRKIKSNAKLEHEFLHNLKLFQAAFTKLNFDKSVPIDRLMKGKFQDNFEFLQWFKKFFDTHAAGKENLKVPAALAAMSKNAPKPITICGPSTSGLSTKKISFKLRELQESHEQLSAQMLSVELERNKYYAKLVEIEAILNDSVKNEVYVDWCNRALSVLYAVDDKSSGHEEVAGTCPAGTATVTADL